MLRQGDVRLVRYDKGDPEINVNRSSIDLFTAMKPNLNCGRINDILNDIIYIAVKDACYEAVKYDQKYARFDKIAISGMITKYVSIYVDTSDNNVLRLLYNVLIDTFLVGEEKQDQNLRMFIDNIYTKVMNLLPN